MHAALPVLPAVVLVALTLGVATRAQSRSTPEAQERAQVKARNDFLDGLRKLDLETEAGCHAAIARIEDPATKKTWGGTDIASDVVNILAKAKTNLAALRVKAESPEELDKLNARLANLKSLSTDELVEIAGQIAGLESNLAGLDSKAQEQLTQNRQLVARTLAVRRHDEARTIATAHRDKPRDALAKYARAEDEIRKMLDGSLVQANALEARSRKEPNLAKAATEARTTFELLQQHYRDILAESDALCAAAFHPVEIEKTPWTDLLAPDAKWSASALPGFEHRIENGTMVIEGPDPATKKEGVMSIGDREQWRDFIVDFELTFESGSLRMFFRLGPKTIQNTENILVQSYAAGAAPPLQGKSYQGEASVIGSKFHFQLKAEGLEPVDADIKWVNSRKGAFALVIPDGTKVKFTRLRVRALR